MLIAAFATWHDDHERAKQALAAKPSVVGHVFIETYSVLTRLPQPQRAEPALVMQFLEVNLSTDPVRT